MAKRTQAHYCDTRVLSLCTAVSFDSLRTRLMDRALIRVLLEINKARCASRHHVILEWPDGVLACVISEAAITFNSLTPTEKIAAYHCGLAGKVIYRAQRKADNGDAQGTAWSLPLFSDPLSREELRSPSRVADVDDLKQALRQFGKGLDSKDECECFLACRRASRTRAYFVELAVWNDGTWACLHFEGAWRWSVPPGQYEKAYHSARQGKHFYHLETTTTKDLIVHVT